MASRAPAPAPAEQAQSRPSFAKVAASAIKPSNAQEPPAKTRPPVATPRNLALPPNARAAPAIAPTPKAPAETAEMATTNDNAGSTAVRTGEWTDAAVQSAAPSSDLKELKEEASERPRPIAFVKVAAAEDSSTQLSSSDGSGKPPSIDGKSVTSAATFALDEKESLRPDDSASLRAVEEEDVTSPPDSVLADSRHGSDNGAARAFRDQLHEIAVMNPQPHRGVPPGRFPTLPTGPQALYDPNQLPNAVRPVSQPAVNGMPQTNGGPALPAEPDEKLLEALQSPRDRLFIVKLEQDFIDFIKEPRESEYALPNCNTFYRMLAHRLADYYLLGHVVDSTMTGVKITRTPYCRIPPPVSQMVDPAKGASTPPADLPARKIMRRDDGKSGTNTTANSQSASKTTSEVGGSDGSNDGNDKAALTREEREARYKEARQRIFGHAESGENEATEGTGSADDKDKNISRSSSAAGKKKNKKQRNYDDDDFQARSRFNVYYPQQYPASGFSAEHAVYYNGYPGPVPNAQYHNMNPGASPLQSYNSPYPGTMSAEGQAPYGWAGQQSQPPNNSMGFLNYGQMQSGYDLSNDFQRTMSFQNTAIQNTAMPSQVTPKMGNVPMASYQDSYQQPQHMPVAPGWSQIHQQPYPMAQGSYAPSGPGIRPMSAPHQGPMSNSYAYGQFPTTPYNGKPNHHQHPIPGSYNRQQFNPQSQAFIPGGRNMPYPMQASMSQGPPPMSWYGYNNHQIPGPNGMPHQVPRVSPSAASTPPFGSPQSMQGNGSAGSMHRNTTQPSDPASSNSIAKYGTPAHLPAKPPAPVPAPQSGPKLPSMMRTPSNIGPTLVSSGGTIPVCSASGQNNTSH